MCVCGVARKGPRVRRLVVGVVGRRRVGSIRRLPRVRPVHGRGLGAFRRGSSRVLVGWMGSTRRNGLRRRGAAGSVLVVRIARVWMSRGEHSSSFAKRWWDADGASGARSLVAESSDAPPEPVESRAERLSGPALPCTGSWVVGSGLQECAEVKRWRRRRWVAVCLSCTIQRRLRGIRTAKASDCRLVRKARNGPMCPERTLRCAHLAREHKAAAVAKLIEE